MNGKRVPWDQERPPFIAVRSCKISRCRHCLNLTLYSPLGPKRVIVEFDKRIAVATWRRMTVDDAS